MRNCPIILVGIQHLYRCWSIFFMIEFDVEEFHPQSQKEKLEERVSRFTKLLPEDPLELESSMQVSSFESMLSRAMRLPTSIKAPLVAWVRNSTDETSAMHPLIPYNYVISGFKFVITVH